MRLLPVRRRKSTKYHRNFWNMISKVPQIRGKTHISVFDSVHSCAAIFFRRWLIMFIIINIMISSLRTYFPLCVCVCCFSGSMSRATKQRNGSEKKRRKDRWPNLAFSVPPIDTAICEPRRRTSLHNRVETTPRIWKRHALEELYYGLAYFLGGGIKVMGNTASHE